ncbi:MAG: phosphatase PAP2 family protein [Actinomycetota bacterium]
MTLRPRMRAVSLLAARLTAAAAGLVVAAIPFALLLLRVLQHGRLAGVDARIAGRLNRLAYQSPRASHFAHVFTDLGHWMVLSTAVAGIAICLVVVRRRRDAIFLVTTAVTGVLVDSVLKKVVVRARSAFAAPVASGLDKSFPSGHAMNSAFVYGALLLIVLPVLRPHARIVAVIGTAVFVIAICASRVALGLHYISDVIGGASFGIAWLAASVWAFSGWRRESAV